MNGIRVSILLLACHLFSGAVVAADGFQSTIVEESIVRTPEPGSGEARVGPGESLFSERHQMIEKTLTSFAVLAEDFALGSGAKVDLKAGLRLGNFFLTDPNRPVVYMRCSAAHTAIKQTLMSGPLFKKAVCFREMNGKLAPAFFKGYGPTPDRSTRLEYKLVQEETASRTVGHGRFELLYQGAGGGVLRLAYREFTGEELARPAFTQEVSYDLSKEGPTEVRFKGATIHVLGADNLGIHYRVDSPFRF